MIAKLRSDGTFVWATKFEGLLNGYAKPIAVDALGNLYLTGEFEGTADLDPGPGIVSLTSNDDTDGFVAKFDPDANLLWARKVGADWVYSSSAITVGPDGHVHVAGTFYGTIDFDPGPGRIEATSNANRDVFVVKLTSSGDTVWAGAVGGRYDDQVYGLAVDADGETYVGGLFSETADVDPGPGIARLWFTDHLNQGFVVRLDSEGKLLAARNIGRHVQAIAFDSAGTPHVTGNFTNTFDFDPGPDLASLTSSSFFDVFITKLFVEGPILDVPLEVSIAENGIVVVDATAFDVADTEGDGLTYRLTAGADRALFTVEASTGIISFVSSPDFEDPTDADADNDYEVELTVTNHNGHEHTLPITVTITDVLGDIAPTITSPSTATVLSGQTAAIDVDSLDDLDAEGDGLGYRFGGGDDDGLFAVDADTGVVTFLDPAPDFANPKDANGDNDYEVTVVVADAGGLTDSDEIVITVVAGLEVLPGFAATFGGTGTEQVHAVTTDAAGNIYMAGQFNGTADFDPGAGATNLTSHGEYDMYITKFDPTGNLIWARNFGGSDWDSVRSLAFDPAGYLYATGEFRGTVDFGPGPGETVLTSVGRADAFILKLDLDGQIHWVARFGGTENAGGSAIAVDNDGNTLTAGSYVRTVDFDPGPGLMELTSKRRSSDGFITKLDPDGNLLWVRSIGSDKRESVNSIAVDNDGNVYTTGHFDQEVDLDPGPGVELVSTFSGGTFVLKLNSAGDYVWGQSPVGTDVRMQELAIDGQGDIAIAGQFHYVADFDPETAAGDLTSSGGFNAFVSKLDSDGNLLWVNGFDGSNGAPGVAFDSGGNVLTTGSFSGTADLDPGPEVANLTADGESAYSAFVSKLDPDGNYIWARSVGGRDGGTFGTSIAIDSQDNAIVGGVFNGGADFDPGPGTIDRTSKGDDDGFILKLDLDGNLR